MATRDIQQSLFRIGDFELDVGKRSLHFRGTRVALTPKEFDLLGYLVRANGRMVTKDELIYALWPNEGISDANLAQVMYRLRKSLARPAPDVEFIATIPGQGYQFVAGVQDGIPLISGRAFQLYRNAKYLLALRTGSSMWRSIEIFKQAVAMEPQFAQAFVGIAEAYAFLAEYLYVEPAQGFPLAKQAAQTALSVDSRCAEAYSALGEVLLFYERDWGGAHKAYETALGLAPYSTTARLLSAWHSLVVGQGEMAVQKLEAALTIDPTSILLNTTLGVVHFYCRDFETSRRQLQDVLLLEPGSALAQFYYALVLAQAGDFNAAISALGSIAPLEYEVQAAAIAGYCYGRLGNTAAARKQLDFLEQPGDGRQISQINRALVFAGLGDRAGALQALDLAYAQSEPWLPLLLVHPFLDALRNEPSFQQLICKIEGR